MKGHTGSHQSDLKLFPNKLAILSKLYSMYFYGGLCLRQIVSNVETVSGNYKLQSSMIF